MNKEITMFELLKLIKDGMAPKKIIIRLPINDKIYEFDEKRKWYFIGGTIPLIIDNITDLYLILNILDKDDEFEDIEEYNLTPDDWSTPTQADMEIQKRMNVIIRNQKKIIERLKEDE